MNIQKWKQKYCNFNYDFGDVFWRCPKLQKKYKKTIDILCKRVYTNKSQRKSKSKIKSKNVEKGEMRK